MFSYIDWANPSEDHKLEQAPPQSPPATANEPNALRLAVA
jgi:hypothetical protein